MKWNLRKLIQNFTDKFSDLKYFIQNALSSKKGKQTLAAKGDWDRSYPVNQGTSPELNKPEQRKLFSKLISLNFRRKKSSSELPAFCDYEPIGLIIPVVTVLSNDPPKGPDLTPTKGPDLTPKNSISEHIEI